MTTKNKAIKKTLATPATEEPKVTPVIKMTKKLKIPSAGAHDEINEQGETVDNISNGDHIPDTTNKSVSELTIEEQYKKMDQKEHILKLPDTYIGSIEMQEEPMWIIDEKSDQTNEGGSLESQAGGSDDTNPEDNTSNPGIEPTQPSKESTPAPSQVTSPTSSRTTSRASESNGKGMTRMIMKKIRYVPGLYKIYDEVLVNAIDHWTRMDVRIKTQLRIKKGEISETPEVNLKMKFRPVKNIRVDIDQAANTISVYNDGDGIPIAMHSEYQVYVPELLFSQLLTSGNYKGDKVNQTNIIGGKNGYGSKLAALFSTSFTIETVDMVRHKKYTQTYRDNLQVIEPPVIEDFAGLPYTKITFSPDLVRFGLPDGLTDDMVTMFKKRVYDAAGWCTGVNVFYNDFRIPIRDFNQYMNLYLGSRLDRKRYFCVNNERWEVGCTYSDHQEFQQVSMVNGINTSKGGRHVNYIADQIARNLAKEISTEKNVVDQRTVRANMWLFLRCVIENPKFDSQTKEGMTSLVTQFGSKCDLSQEDIKKIGAVGISKRSKDFSMFKDALTTTNKSTDGKKVGRVHVDKLDDAEYAGRNKLSEKCVLILTEGDSAMGFATEGRMALSAEERNYYGIFPLRGKMLNVRDASQKDIDKNTEVANLKTIIGLQSGVDYSGPEGIKKLRYGKIMILTDSDNDGDHIKGLIINFFHKFWPSLIETDNFITAMITPIVAVWKERRVGRKTERYNVHKFYSENVFYEWKKSNDDGKGWKSRYYKGLGTSRPEDAKESFVEKKIIRYIRDPIIEDDTGRKIDPTSDAINLAFLKENADPRKKWLQEADLDQINEYDIATETYKDFINHRLVHFSWADTYRSIPNICDGLKPSMRKIVYCCLKNNITNELKVAQLAAKVSETTAYHHGEKSLEGTVVGLAQDYVGSNNINLLFPSGLFGTKAAMGSDAASSRYIYTRLEDMTPFIYRKEDTLLYKYLTDDGLPIEPQWFLPIIPMVLVNGADGIGTGYSTKVYQYNPLDLVVRIRKLLNNGTLAGMAEPIPWYRGFTGKIVPDKEVKGFVSRYICIGNYHVTQDSVRIKELPVDVCFNSYKKFLEELVINVNEDERKKRATENKSSFNAYSSILFGMVKDVHIDTSFCQAEIIFKKGALAELLARGVEKFEKDLKLRSYLPVTNMVLFDHNLEIRKYNTVNEITQSYFNVRLEYYNHRRKLLIGEANFNALRVNSKLRFVTEIMNEQLVIYKKSRKDIITMLETHNYPKYVSRFDPRTVIGDLYNQKDCVVETIKVDDLESNGDIDNTNDEDDDDNDDQEGGAKKKKKKESNVPSYNYLLTMRIDSFSQEMLNKLTLEANDLQAKVDRYTNCTSKQLWDEDLVEFEKEYLEWLTEWYRGNKIETPELKGKIIMNVKNLLNRRPTVAAIENKKVITPDPKKQAETSLVIDDEISE